MIDTRLRMRFRDVVVEKQEPLGFRFKINTTSSTSPANHVLNQDESSVVELTKRDVELVRANVSTRSIFGNPFDDIKLLYALGGSKSILKRKLSKEDKEVVRNEVEIVKQLSIGETKCCGILGSV